MKEALAPFDFRSWVVLAFVFSIFSTKLIDGLFFKLHLINLVLGLVLLICIIAARYWRVDRLLLVYLGVVTAGILVGYATPAVPTDFAVAPLVTDYQYPTQPLVGFLYTTRYLLVMGTLLATGFAVSRQTLHKIIRFIYLVLAVCCIGAIAEFLYSPMHEYLYSISEYEKDFSFVYRGVSMFLNVYDGSFMMMAFVALAIFFYERKKSLLRFLPIVVGSVAVILHGTRTGYLGLPLLLLANIFFAEMAVRKKVLIVFVLLGLLVGGILGLALLVADVRTNLDSIVKLSDAAGSTEQHLGRAQASLMMVLKHPFGLGTGKTNFAAIDNPIWFGTESFVLSLAIDCGVLAVVLFFWYHWKLLRLLFKVTYDRIYARAIASYLVTVLILSVVNMQCFASVVITSLISVLVALHLNAASSTTTAPPEHAGMRRA